MSEKTLAEKVVERLYNHPESLDMRQWVCGTTACLAGHICLALGCTLHESQNDDGVTWAEKPGSEERFSISEEAYLGWKEAYGESSAAHVNGIFDEVRATLDDVIEAVPELRKAWDARLKQGEFQWPR